MTPASLQLQVTKGITFGPVLIHCKGAGGTPLNLTGYTVHAQARTSPSASLAFSLPATITDAAAGTITLAWTDEQTAALPPGGFAWDLVLGTPTGERIGPILAGSINIIPIITRP